MIAIEPKEGTGEEEGRRSVLLRKLRSRNAAARWRRSREHPGRSLTRERGPPGRPRNWELPWSEDRPSGRGLSCASASKQVRKGAAMASYEL